MRERGRDQQVRRILENIIREAELQAELVCGFLQANGIKPSRKTQPPVQSVSPEVEQFLLGLGAALRAGSWERAGMSQALSRAPGAAKVLQEIDTAESSSEASHLPSVEAVMQTAWFELASEGQSLLGADMVLPAKLDMDKLLDQLAELLYDNRHLIADKEYPNDPKTN